MPLLRPALVGLHSTHAKSTVVLLGHWQNPPIAQRDNVARRKGRDGQAGSPGHGWRGYAGQPPRRSPCVDVGSGHPRDPVRQGEDGYVAYQVFGRGSFDLLFIGNWASNVEVMWEHPSMARLDRLGQFARVICFDKRGAGLSDPVAQGALPTLEHWMDDARIVLEAAGSETAALIGDAEGGPMAMMFAATYPQRTRALVLVNTFARMLRAADYPIGMPEDAAERFLEVWERSWGTGVVLELSAPSVAADAQMQRWAGRYMRLSVPPAIYPDVPMGAPGGRAVGAAEHPGANADRAPGREPSTTGRRWVSTSPITFHAKYVELPGADWYPPFVNAEPVLDQIEEFLTGARPAPAEDRILATVLFTDIVGSTDLAARLGDQRWLDLRAAHDVLVRMLLDRYRGKDVATGDGFLGDL